MLSLGNRHETYLSTIRCASQKNPWVFGQNENPRRPSSDSRPSCQRSQASWCLKIAEKKKRFQALCDPASFQQSLRTKPIARVGSVLIHLGPPSDVHRLGFVLPKKLVKYAVQRNQIKRWSKAALQQSLWESMPPSTLIVRVNTSVPKSSWLVSGRTQTRGELLLALQHALDRIETSKPKGLVT